MVKAKKIAISITLFFLIINTYGQQDAINTSGKHELRWDAFDLIVLERFEINYEYVINTYSGVGLTLAVNLDSSLNEENKFTFEPFYRMYFFDRKDFGAKGFFVEGLTRFAIREQEVVNQFFMVEQENQIDFGLSIGLGQKWINNNGFVLEIGIGMGRYFLNDTIDDLFARGGITVGYRL